MLTKQKYFIAPKASIIINLKVATSSIARAIIAEHPEIERRIQAAHYPDGRGPNTTMWQGMCPKAEQTDLPIIALIRDPVDRFLSAMVQFQLTDVDAAIGSLKSGRKVQTPRREISLQSNPHFAKQYDRVEADTKLYKFPEHLEQFCEAAGLQYPLPTINAARTPKPTLTDTQRSAIEEYYSDDMALFASI